jgi:feruloyl esterase
VLLTKIHLCSMGVLLLAAPVSGQALDAAACEKLTSLNLTHATLKAELIAPGAFTPTQMSGGVPLSPQALAALPAFCRVSGSLTPTADSDIRIEVWLPAEKWNGKLEGVGDGGWGGSIFYFLMADGLRRGYAVVATDTGHVGNGGDGKFALNHPEKLTDFAYRAVHEMTTTAKTVVMGAYGHGPRLSYWNGCSTGGRQGLKEAQNYPADYDGIVVGAPANYMTHLLVQSLWVSRATLTNPASALSPTQFAALHDAAVKQCDEIDGVKDGLLRDPTLCKFDPASIACPSGGDAGSCLTPPQIEAARKIYGDAKNPRTGEVIFPGLERASERGWGPLAGGPAPFSIAADYFKYVIYKNPDWDFRTLDFDKDTALADKTDNGLLNATDPDLKPFFALGGKLLLHHGWADPLIAPRNTINYYNSVLKEVGADVASQSMRLFMAPGMDHCFGGEGPNLFDGLASLEEWVEQKHVPERIVAVHMSSGKADRTRPLCRYPQVAIYSGTGSTDDEANFACKVP